MRIAGPHALCAVQRYITPSWVLLLAGAAGEASILELIQAFKQRWTVIEFDFDFRLDGRPIREELTDAGDTLRIDHHTISQTYPSKVKLLHDVGVATQHLH